MSLQIKINKNNQSNLKNIDFQNLQFGNTFSDHMLIADFYEDKWQNWRIEPFQNLSLNPASFVLHYGQSIFEGLKVEVSPEGKPILFRPYENAKRFRSSARRMALPEIEEEDFVEAIKTLVKLDIDWIPKNNPSASLYVRPFLFGVEEALGVKVGAHYKFVVIIGPVGAYYSQPINVWLQDIYVRANLGGTGAAKCAGNYAATLNPMLEAKKRDCAQILWTEGPDHKRIQEVGTMNIFFEIDGKLITPSLERNTVLRGVTRDSILQISKDIGYLCQEREILVDEVLEAYNTGRLTDCFGTGTAAVIYPIQKILYQDKWLDMSHVTREKSQKLKHHLIEYKLGKIQDIHNWIVPIE
ncbi:MAG: branched-chain amino acid aminotransferase [Chitinophagales bacterium]|jgi:branched-chain amino acid aminotransferase|nr:branched-chain amino acid aminotransferase [Chitinophagales bacterium]